MDLDNLKDRIGANIAMQRKRVGLTQAGLAEKLNYSDKAISKWERGESMPDVLTLMHDRFVQIHSLPTTRGMGSLSYSNNAELLREVKLLK